MPDVSLSVCGVSSVPSATHWRSAAVDLVGAGERHAVEKKHAPRMLIGRTVGERECFDLVLGRAVPLRSTTNAYGTWPFIS